MTNKDSSPTPTPEMEPNPPDDQPARSRFWRRPKPTAEDISDRQIKKWSEVWATIILSVATLVTAWAGYEAGKWNGLQTSLNLQTTILNIDSARLTAESQQMLLVDIGLFTNWANAVGTGNTRLQDFYEAMFRDDFRPAFDAWLAERPLENPDAPRSPFDMPEYLSPKEEEAMALLEQTEQLIRSAENAGAIADRYTLSVVILAGALLLAGLANRFEWAELRAVVVVVALIVLVVSIVNVIRLPAV